MAKTEGAPAHGAVAHLLPQTYKRFVSEWLEEDTPSFDYGGFVVGEEMSEAKLLGKSEVRNLPFTASAFAFLWADKKTGHSCWRAIFRRSVPTAGLHVSLFPSYLALF